MCNKWFLSLTTIYLTFVFHFFLNGFWSYVPIDGKINIKFPKEMSSVEPS